MVIEDDSDVRRGMLRCLSAADFAVSSAGSALAGLKAVVATTPDLVVLDLGLPDLAGKDLLLMIRAVSQVPILVATAHDGEPEVVEVLNAGADDYVIKPFSGDQLVARVRAVLRRGAAGGAHAGTARIRVGELIIDPSRRTVELAGRTVALSPKEFDLLRYLGEQSGRVVTKRELFAEVWHQQYQASDKTVDVHLSWLRRKLGEDAQCPRYLHTVRGVGVRLDQPAV